MLVRPPHEQFQEDYAVSAWSPLPPSMKALAHWLLVEVRGGRGSAFDLPSSNPRLPSSKIKHFLSTSLVSLVTFEQQAAEPSLLVTILEISPRHSWISFYWCVIGLFFLFKTNSPVHRHLDCLHFFYNTMTQSTCVSVWIQYAYMCIPTYRCRWKSLHLFHRFL